MLAQKQKLSTIGLTKKISYKDTNLLKFFITKQGKIIPRRVTGLTVQQQRQLTKAIKRARILSLLPFVTSNLTLNKDKDI
jgi:small subunit ribosomal protein S18|tara:strand:- start:30688 stop:30927 length:240 start_codon:yes stop_codon:yes gene_type:complete